MVFKVVLVVNNVDYFVYNNLITQMLHEKFCVI